MRPSDQDPLLARVRWGNVVRVLAVVGAVALVVAWPRLSPGEPELPPAAPRLAPPPALPGEAVTRAAPPLVVEPIRAAPPSRSAERGSPSKHSRPRRRKPRKPAVASPPPLLSAPAPPVPRYAPPPPAEFLPG